MKASPVPLMIFVALTVTASGQESGAKTDAPSPETAAVLANDRAYEAAYAKADVGVLSSFFTEDAEYTSDDGRTFAGKAAIEECLRSAFIGNKGSRIAIFPDSVKVLTPDVVVEKGSSVVTSQEGETAEALYTAVHLKKDGQWKISQLVETPSPETSPSDHLAGLSWLIGEWNEADKDEGLTVNSRYQWARGGNFITRNVTVKRGGDPVLEGWQIIGWDPVQETIRSWTFDGEGGHAQGIWTCEGERWLARETGYAADGSRTASDQTITRAGEDRFYWESGNRTLDGDPQPGIGRIEIQRVKGE